MRVSKVSIAAVALFVILWEASVRLGLLPAALPAPSGVINAFPRISNQIPINAAYSLLHLVTGFGLAIAVAIPAGMVIGWFPLARRAIDPIVEIIRPIPPIAWIPFALLAFYTYLEASAFIIFIGSFFPVLTNTYMGFRNTPMKYVEVARSFGASELQLLTKVAFPSALPIVFNGVRVGLGVGWMCVVGAELFVPNGLGWMIIQMRYLHDIEAVVAFMIVIGVLGFVMERGFKLLESKALRWQKGLIREG